MNTLSKNHIFFWNAWTIFKNHEYFFKKDEQTLKFMIFLISWLLKKSWTIVENSWTKNQIHEQFFKGAREHFSKIMNNFFEKVKISWNHEQIIIFSKNIKI
jgi:hypothetical protein